MPIPCAKTVAPVLFVAAAALLAGCDRHDLSRAEANTSAAPPPAGSAATSGRTAVSTWASHLLMSADTARQAIARGDRAAAAGAVDAAIGFSDKLGSRAVAPIYSELSSVSVIGPVQAAKAGASGAATKASAPATIRPDAVKAVAGGYTRIVLNANLARARLLAAKAEIARGDLARADGDLRTLQSGVALETVSANLPLVRARENVGLAETSAQAGRTAAAKSQLAAAQKALASYAQSSPASPHAGDAEVMASEMAGAAATAPPGKAAAPGQLAQWWSKLADWTDAA